MITLMTNRKIIFKVHNINMVNDGENLVINAETKEKMFHFWNAVENKELTEEAFEHIKNQLLNGQTVIDISAWLLP